MTNDQAQNKGAFAARWLALRQDESLRGRAWSDAAADAADDWLSGLFEQATASFSGSAALMAVGSLGRRDLAPGSDLDLVLVHDSKKDLQRIADALWYPIWDEPMPLDHSVRTLGQVSAAAESDLRVALGLLDARRVAGDEHLAERFVELGRALWTKKAKQWVPILAQSTEERHRGSGDVAFLLEPDVRDSKGGLRDLQALEVLARVTPVDGLEDILDRLGAPADRLFEVRVELQRSPGRRGDRLALQDHDRLAEALGLSGRDELAMEVSKAGRAIAWSSDDAWRRVGSWLRAGRKGRANVVAKFLGDGLVHQDGAVAIVDGIIIKSDPTLPLRAAQACAELGAPLERGTQERLAAEALAPREPWSPEVTRAFIGLLSTGEAGVYAIETLDQIGVWQRYMPEWDLVRNRPQHNPYHRWTVDRHLLEAVAQCKPLLRDVRRPDLLLLTALLHDIGKGQGGSHSERGAAMTEVVARRLGFDEEDRDVLVRAVRHHLLLSDTATRRDLEDPATSASVMALVPDSTTLEVLAALSVADGKATGPTSWNPWRARLVRQLVSSVTALQAGKPATVGSGWPTEEHLAAMVPGRLSVERDEHGITLVLPDRPGLLSLVAGVMALRGVSIVEARVHSQDGVALQSIVPDMFSSEEIPLYRIRRDIELALSGELDLSKALIERALSDRRRRRLPSPPPDVRVLVDNEAGSESTVVEVRAPDGRAVLHRITATMAEEGLDIVSALLVTLGNAVVDTFYVRKQGSKITDRDDISRLEKRIIDELEELHALFTSGS